MEEAKKMQTAKIGTLFLVSILALGGIGISYAAWTESVDMNVTATTGNLDFRLKDIDIVDADGATINLVKVDPYEWTVTVSNTYPGWEGYLNIIHRNAGTVDLKFDSFQVLNLVGPAALKNGYTIKFYPPGDPTPNIVGTLNEFRVKQDYDDLIGPYEIIVPVGGEHTSQISMELDSGITGFEDTSVTFTFRLWATQA